MSDPKVTFALPQWMYSDALDRAARQGVTVTLFVRRAIALYDVVHEDPDTQIVLRNRQTGEERFLVVL